ncbi:DNA (cytosine-5)-methyltransferase 3-like [Rhineura floridana]|uniref:DNA (cytosine-5)-methyltransferase 3-like n=1 Tax=Rhineura floridana TaxID=261503 RepID=UPI002AC88BC8|nr:DNA (cytosine-5)-methyltransferase 3-like [Rhineura floridana]
MGVESGKQILLTHWTNSFSRGSQSLPFLLANPFGDPELLRMPADQTPAISRVHVTTIRVIAPLSKAAGLFCENGLCSRELMDLLQEGHFPLAFLRPRRPDLALPFQPARTHPKRSSSPPRSRLQAARDERATRGKRSERAKRLFRRRAGQRKGQPLGVSVLSSQGGHADIISVSSVEEMPPASPPGPNAKNIAYEVNFKKRNIEEICICCGSLEIHTQHPLFQGGMCAPCTERFLERFFLCDDDGYAADCTVCCWGKSLIMCDDTQCHRCFCEQCVDTLVRPGLSEGIKERQSWICFMCAPHEVHGLLKRKTKWHAELKRFYDQGSVRKSSTQIYHPLKKWEKKTIHVLSIFDNITEELKSFGFLGQGNGRLKYLDDVTNVKRTHIEEWGPYDFLFGSTPPIANSYQQPSAWYFYQYFRILQYATPPESKKMFFWMFVDNLVLEEEDRDTASRFFQMEAVLRYKQHDDLIQNAVHVWSNIPSVNSKYSASSLYVDLSLLAKNILKTRIFSQRPATLIKEFFVPLKEYFRTFP